MLIHERLDATLSAQQGLILTNRQLCAHLVSCLATLALIRTLALRVIGLTWAIKLSFSLSENKSALKSAPTFQYPRQVNSATLVWLLVRLVSTCQATVWHALKDIICTKTTSVSRAVPSFTLKMTKSASAATLESFRFQFLSPSLHLCALSVSAFLLLSREPTRMEKSRKELHSLWQCLLSWIWSCEYAGPSLPMLSTRKSSISHLVSSVEYWACLCSSTSSCGGATFTRSINTKKQIHSSQLTVPNTAGLPTLASFWATFSHSKPLDWPTQDFWGRKSSWQGSPREDGTSDWSAAWRCLNAFWSTSQPLPSTFTA